ncbi:hypothetical protein [Weissella cibaria]|uniref:Capsular polysaccharide biosynthesis protein CpsC n=1 Tax=Weissella cibaria TaxID=137591 RepID=A0A0D1LJ12_9LACO|nr:hypothetical protein [Weissella cibaria]KIU20420.1 hypothetical protein QX99_01228 [Weissella cibaria]MDV8930780.1 hypothetical protein [Weissella cibaria]
MVNNNSSLNVVEFVNVLKKSSILGILLAVLASVGMYLGAGAYVKRMPEYLSTLQVVVATNPKEDKSVDGDLMHTVVTDGNLIDTYLDLIVSYDVVKTAMINTNELSSDLISTKRVVAKKIVSLQQWVTQKPKL